MENYSCPNCGSDLLFDPHEDTCYDCGWDGDDPVEEEEYYEEDPPEEEDSTE